MTKHCKCYSGEGQEKCQPTDIETREPEVESRDPEIQPPTKKRKSKKYVQPD